MNEEQWSSVDNYLVALLAPSDEALTSALADSEAAGLPPIAVAPNQGKMLELLARATGARRILEIGTLGGYSTISLARAVPVGGALITLELEEKHARVARVNIERAGLSGVVTVQVGPAADSLRSLVAQEEDTFDFIFIDADKEGYPEYLELSLALAHVGTLIVADNVIRNGEVANPNSSDERVRGVQLFLELAAADPRVSATAIQTVGSKGYDGFALLLVI
jgi:predicted O-methyltransferase YrrM